MKKPERAPGDPSLFHILQQFSENVPSVVVGVEVEELINTVQTLRRRFGFVEQWRLRRLDPSTNQPEPARWRAFSVQVVQVSLLLLVRIGCVFRTVALTVRGVDKNYLDG